MVGGDLTLEDAAGCVLLAQVLLERFADEELDQQIPSTALRRGFLRTGQLEHILVCLMALAHKSYPQLADEEVFASAIRDNLSCSAAIN